MYLQVREFGCEVSKFVPIKVPSLSASIKHVKRCILDQVIKSRRRSSCPSFATSFDPPLERETPNDGDKKKDEDEDEEVNGIRIFFDGKELQSQYSVYQYGIKLNDILQFIYTPQFRIETFYASRTPTTLIQTPTLTPANCPQILSHESSNHQPFGGHDGNHDTFNGTIYQPSLPLTPETPTFNGVESDANNKCQTCHDDASKRCKSCSCIVCGSKDDPDKQLICDECDNYYHTYCVFMDSVPSDAEDWFCPTCKNVDSFLIKDKEDNFLLRRSSTDANSTDKKTDNNTDKKKKSYNWGRGLSCIGRRFNPKDDFRDNIYFGPIPGIEVGTTFKFRFQLSEVGVHTPLIAGVAGKSSLGAVSVVFSNSYQNDVDLGTEIYFSGSGGTNSSAKSARTGNVQIKDQELTKSNRALARSCYAVLDDVNGGDAGNYWRLGKPIRVCRSGNARGKVKKSVYLPKTGIRYDGVYKVVKYWREKCGASKFFIWRFLLRRDDEAPAPWTRDGYNRVRRLKLDKIIDPSNTSYQDCNQDNDLKVGVCFNECSICLNRIETNGATLIPCKHVFDLDCIKKWTSNGTDCDLGVCPSCRRSINEVHYLDKIIKTVKSLMRTKN